VQADRSEARRLLDGAGWQPGDDGIRVKDGKRLAFEWRQCRRVALARAVVARPHLVLADEPTSALDVSVAAGVLGALRDAVVACGAALVIVSHDLLAIAPLVDRILVLDRGRVVEEGATERIMRAAAHPVTRRLVEAARLLAAPAANAGDQPAAQAPDGLGPATPYPGQSSRHRCHMPARRPAAHHERVAAG
jgi:ABC-type glutathione transport system ATPase component